MYLMIAIAVDRLEILYVRAYENPYKLWNRYKDNIKRHTNNFGVQYYVATLFTDSVFSTMEIEEWREHIKTSYGKCLN